MSIKKIRIKEIAEFIIQFILECLLLGMCVSGVIVSAVVIILEHSWLKRCLWSLLAGFMMYLLIALIMSITNKWKGSNLKTL